ncbi:conserved exported hypothetical protein [Candidatus Sulfopaludibacter sp. SbA3]|nr:conserved exported hypothetical protein [Candidatus Sulfopaludibacter sp. SbA3]
MLRWLLLFCCAPLLFAQSDAIRKMMDDSAEAWNRGDLPAFASYYDDSPQTTFMGRDIVRGGTQAILERYRQAYPSREAMGTLVFSEIEVRPLAEGVALVTGRYELKRTASGGGAAWGRYTLIVRRTAGGWKIIHDHTTSY